MFAKACEKAARYTHPLVNNIRTVDGTVTSVFGTYFFINKQGWAVSAAHVFNSMMKAQYDAQHIKEIKTIQEKDAAEGKPTTAMMDPKWITNHSFWFGSDQIRLSSVSLIANADLAVFKLDHVPENFISETAVLGDINNLKPGMSLCKLGYSFINVETKFENGGFRIPNIAQVAPFPIDGIYTRTVAEVDEDKKLIMKFIETSTPGLQGQSGGPTFDVNGVVYAVQSRTRHMPLGFTPKVVEGNETITTHQFLNVGNGIPIDILQKWLLDQKIPFDTVNKDSDGCEYFIR